MAKVDYYRVLGLQPTATREEVRRAYRRLARRLHPDVDPERKDEARATQRMVRLNEAYAVLADPARRAAYDAQRLASRVATGWEDGQAGSAGPRVWERGQAGKAEPRAGAGPQSDYAGKPDPRAAPGTGWRQGGLPMVVLAPSPDRQARRTVLAVLLTAAGIYGANLTVSRGSLLGVLMMAVGLLSGAMCALAVMPTFHGRLVLTHDALIEHASFGLTGERAYGYEQICEVHWRAKHGLTASTRILIDYYTHDRLGRLRTEWYESKWLMPVDDPHTLYAVLRERAAAQKYEWSRPSWRAVIVQARELVVTVVVVFGTVVAALLWGTSPGG
jgi:hypothetical protein